MFLVQFLLLFVRSDYRTLYDEKYCEHRIRVVCWFGVVCSSSPASAVLPVLRCSFRVRSHGFFALVLRALSINQVALLLFSILRLVLLTVVFLIVLVKVQR